MFQLELPGQHAVEVGYVGTRGDNLETFVNLNNVTRLLPPGTDPAPHVSVPTSARSSPYVRTVGESRYDSMQLKFQRRYHKGLQFLVSYTLSEATTNAGDSLSGGGVGGLRAPDVVGWDLENDIGLSGFHTRHALVVSGNYDLPFEGAISATGASTGWRPSTAARPRQSTARRRRAQAPAATRSSSAIRMRATTTWPTSTTRPRSPTRLRWRPSGRPTSARWAGRAARSPGRRCGRSTWAWRGSSVSGDEQAEFRLEVFNLTNTPSFNLPGSLNFGDARNFASITSMRNTPRQIQVGLKFYW